MQSWRRQQCAWYLENLLWFSGIFAVEIQRNSHDNSVWRGSTAAKKADALIRCRCASFFVVCLLQKKKNKDRLRHKSRFETRGKYEGYQHSWGIKPVPIKAEKNYVYFPPEQKNNQDQQTLIPITIDLDLKFPPNYWILPSLVITTPCLCILKLDLFQIGIVSTSGHRISATISSPIWSPTWQ